MTTTKFNSGRGGFRGGVKPKLPDHLKRIPVSARIRKWMADALKHQGKLGDMLEQMILNAGYRPPYDVISICEHAKNEVIHPELGEVVKIDKDIALLIHALWQIGIDTNRSCQGNREQIWIEFASANDVERFVNTILSAGNSDDGIYHRILGKGDHAWHYHILPEDISVEPNTSNAGPSEIIMKVSVWFPNFDYNQVLEIIEKDYNSP